MTKYLLKFQFSPTFSKSVDTKYTENGCLLESKWSFDTLFSGNVTGDSCLTLKGQCHEKSVQTETDPKFIVLHCPIEVKQDRVLN